MTAFTGVRTVVRIAVVLALVGAPSVALAASASTSGQVWAINCTREQFKPGRIIISCGDGGTWLGSLKWSSWGSAKAAGAGNYGVLNCTPDCASGHAKTYPVKVTLSKPKACPGQTHLAFKQAALTYTGSRPKGAPANVTFRCPALLPGEY